MCVFMIFYYIIQRGKSFLHSSAVYGQTDVCSFLISKGANINQVDDVSIEFHYSCVTTDNIYIGYIPSNRDTRPVIPCGKEHCLSEAKEIRRLHQISAISRGI